MRTRISPVTIISDPVMTRIAIRPGSPRPRLELRPGALAARVLARGPDSARLALVGLTALLLGGDHVEIDIDVGAGQSLDLVETAGVVAYDAAGQPCSWSTRVRVAAGGRLRWLAQPFVVATGAAVTRRTEIELMPGAAMRWRETLVLGRSGEHGGSLSCFTRIHHNRRPLLIEDLDLTEPSARDQPGMLGSGGHHRVIDQLCCLGAEPAPEPAGMARFDLDGPGTVLRWIGDSTADSPLAV